MSDKGWSRPDRQNNKKGWEQAGHTKYLRSEQLENILRLIRILHKLPIAQLVNIKRRTRPDPRMVPEGTPLCIADWCWRLFNAGAREALGINAASLKRLVLANDAGVSNEGLRALLLREVLA